MPQVYLQVCSTQPDSAGYVDVAFRQFIWGRDPDRVESDRKAIRYLIKNAVSLSPESMRISNITPSGEECPQSIIETLSIKADLSLGEIKAFFATDGLPTLNIEFLTQNPADVTKRVAVTDTETLASVLRRVAPEPMLFMRPRGFPFVGEGTLAAAAAPAAEVSAAPAAEEDTQDKAEGCRIM